MTSNLGFGWHFPSLADASRQDQIYNPRYYLRFISVLALSARSNSSLTRRVHCLFFGARNELDLKTLCATLREYSHATNLYSIDWRVFAFYALQAIQTLPYIPRDGQDHCLSSPAVQQLAK